MHVRPEIHNTERIVNYIDSCSEGDIKNYVRTYGVAYYIPYYKDIIEEINERKFLVSSKMSYSPISKYYTIPMGQPYIDQHPIERHGVKSRQPILPNAKTTPELLLEPFTDDFSQTFHTIAEMVDMYTKKLDFYIINDEDVVAVYFKIKRFINEMSDRTIPKREQAMITMYNNFIGLQKNIQVVFDRVCNKNNWKYDENSMLRIFSTLDVANVGNIRTS